MKLNGWLRLWIVLSVCWLAFVGYFAYGDISSFYTKKTFDVAKEGVANVQVIFSEAQSDTEIKEHIASKLIPFIEKSPRNFADKVITAPYEEHIEKYAEKIIARYAMIALLPIVCLLAIGWSLVWVRRGFSGKSNA